MSSDRSHDCALGCGFLDGLKVFRTGMEKEVDVGVDQAREKSSVAKVDNLRAGGLVDFRADLNDDTVIDPDFAGLDEMARFDVEQPGCVEDDWVRVRCSLGPGRLNAECHAGEKRETSSQKCA